MSRFETLELRAGPVALARLREHGLRPADIACVPAAAGGPKGLGLIPLDHRLFDRERGWLRAVQHLVTPGWLDKHLPWRARPRSHAWLDRMLLIAPSRAQLERLPNRKLPDRNDFYRYGLDHAGRERAWRHAIAECERFADAALAWLETPDPSLVRPL